MYVYVICTGKKYGSDSKLNFVQSMHKYPLAKTLKKVMVVSETKEDLGLRKYYGKHNQNMWMTSGIMPLKVILTKKQKAEERL